MDREFSRMDDVQRREIVLSLLRDWLECHSCRHTGSSCDRTHPRDDLGSRILRAIEILDPKE